VLLLVLSLLFLFILVVFVYCLKHCMSSIVVVVFVAVVVVENSLFFADCFVCCFLAAGFALAAVSVPVGRNVCWG
jgi:hypothetical protein